MKNSFTSFPKPSTRQSLSTESKWKNVIVRKVLNISFDSSREEVINNESFEIPDKQYSAVDKNDFRIIHEGEDVFPTRKENVEFKTGRDFDLASGTNGENTNIAEKRKRVMCLMSDTGGGHRASAQALKDGFHALYGNDFDINIIDLWSSRSPWPLCEMPKSYFFLVKNPWLWRLNFRCSEPKIVHECLFEGYAAIVRKGFSRAFQEYDPHLIVSVHPLMQHVPLKVLKTIAKKAGSNSNIIPFATVVTDLTRCHPTWFHKAVDRCFVATELVAAQAIRIGLKSSQLICHGLPIRPSFSTPNLMSKEDIRSNLGLVRNSKTVMIIGGGEGMGMLESITRALSRTLREEDQIVVICGRNTVLASKLRGEKWPVHVTIKGFVNNMSDFMRACDCIITKAGPGTIAEALICGVPLILNGCIPCQEEGNIPFVIDNGVGSFSTKPEDIAGTVANWFSEEYSSFLAEMSRKAEKLGRPEATFKIVKDLADLSANA
jgi:1,2-diacylglycerol 3-beta-galactosyltransferase